MFESCDIDRCRQSVGDHRTWSGDGYGGHLVGAETGAWIENMMIAPCLIKRRAVTARYGKADVFKVERSSELSLILRVAKADPPRPAIRNLRPSEAIWS